MEKEDTISVQWAQEGVETSYSLLNNNMCRCYQTFEEGNEGTAGCYAELIFNFK